MYLLKTITVLALVAIAQAGSSVSVDEIQEYNKACLVNSLTEGPSNLCAADVDECVLDLYPGSNVCDIKIEVVGCNSSSYYTPATMNNLCTDINFDKNRRTLIVAIGWMSDGYYNYKEKICEIQKKCKEYNVIIVDYACNICMFYKMLRRDLRVAAYSLVKLIECVRQYKLMSEIYLVGFSLGAQIAACAAKLFANELKEKLYKVVLLDPFPLCTPEENHISKDCCEQMIVIHGNNNNYGCREALGTLDFYPNGDTKMQPGCKNHVASHMFPCYMFCELCLNPNSFYAVKATDYNAFNRGSFNVKDITAICLDTPTSCSGKYYAITNGEAPYGLGPNGAKPRSRSFKS